MISILLPSSNVEIVNDLLGSLVPSSLNAINLTTYFVAGNNELI